MENENLSINNSIMNTKLAEAFETKVNDAVISPTVVGDNNSIMGDVTENTIDNPVVAQSPLDVAVGAPVNPMQFQMPPKTRPLVRNYKKIGRNDKCPCGSGKKYKDCCLDSGKYEGYTPDGTQADPYVDTIDNDEAA